MPSTTTISSTRTTTSATKTKKHGTGKIYAQQTKMKRCVQIKIVKYLQGTMRAPPLKILKKKRHTKVKEEQPQTNTITKYLPEWEMFRSGYNFLHHVDLLDGLPSRFQPWGLPRARQSNKLPKKNKNTKVKEEHPQTNTICEYLYEVHIFRPGYNFFRHVTSIEPPTSWRPFSPVHSEQTDHDTSFIEVETEVETKIEEHEDENEVEVDEESESEVNIEASKHRAPPNFDLNDSDSDSGDSNFSY